MIGIIYVTVLITQHVKITLLLLKAVYCVQLFKEEVRQKKKGEPICNNLKLKGPG